MENIQYLVVDVDGTMTDGGIYLDGHGEEIKKFNVKDGAGILLAKKAGIEIIILTGRQSLCVERRCRELDIKYVFQNVKDKKTFLLKFMHDNKIESIQTAYIGDDLNDLPAMHCTGVCACPQDASKQVKLFCPIVLTKKGGEGVVREFVELILEKRGILYEELVV